MGKLVTCIFYFLLDLNCGFFIHQDFGRVLQHKINPEWELHTTLKNAGLFIWLVWTDSLWHLLKFAVIQPQGLGLKHLELHLHMCPSVTVKTSFVFNLAHCVPGGIIYTHETTLSSRLAERQTALLHSETSEGWLLLPQWVSSTQGFAFEHLRLFPVRTRTLAAPLSSRMQTRAWRTKGTSVSKWRRSLRSGLLWWVKTIFWPYSNSWLRPALHCLLLCGLSTS